MNDLNPIRCEARLMGLSKTRRKDGDWVEIKFHIHPDDHPAALFILPLGTDCNLAISGVAESKDDAPDEPVKGGPLARQAGILCGQEPFQSWLFQRELRNDWPGWGDPATAEGHAAGCIRWLCGIDTRAELDHNLTAAQTWKELTDAYYASQHGETTEAFEVMKGEGPG